MDVRIVSASSAMSVASVTAASQTITRMKMMNKSPAPQPCVVFCQFCGEDFIVDTEDELEAHASDCPRDNYQEPPVKGILGRILGSGLCIDIIIGPA